MRFSRRTVAAALSLVSIFSTAIAVWQKPHLLPRSMQPALKALAAALQTAGRTSADPAPLPAEGRTPRGTLQRDADHLLIGSFNIQVFGEQKLAKPEVMDVLTQVARQFDVLAIQEVRAKQSDILPHFIALLNAAGAKYDYVIGPRLGRTASKEQYAFVFDTERVSVDSRNVYTINDPKDRLHREPLVARFVAHGSSTANFSFSLINIHTDPDETKAELNALDDVFRAVQNDGSDEDDVILLGDLNVDERHLGELGQLPGIVWAISGVPTNTRRDRAYDNIVFDGRSTVEYTGESGVYEFEREFHLTRESALQVSDHCPVWARFRIQEGPVRLANSVSASVR